MPAVDGHGGLAPHEEQETERPDELVAQRVARGDVAAQLRDAGRWPEDRGGIEAAMQCRELRRSEGFLLKPGQQRFEEREVVCRRVDAANHLPHADAVRQFSFSKGLFGPNAKSVDDIGIEFPGGKVLGNKANVKLRFDPSFMQMAADGKL